jgi:hypothetical protein
MPVEAAHVAVDELCLEPFGPSRCGGFVDGLPRQVNASHAMTAPGQFEGVTAGAAGHVEQPLLPAQQFFQKVRLGSCLCRTDAFAPKIIGHAVEEILEPVGSRVHGRWRGAFTASFQNAGRRSS